jgi:membrane-bound lytic murein transglycosylase MltF
MRKLIVPLMAVLLATCLCGPLFGQRGVITEKAAGIQADIFMETFFTKRTADLPEMLKLHQIRVLVVPSRSTYFLDDTGQPRGLDYELLKGWEKILNERRPKGEPPVSLIFIPVTPNELADAILEGRGDLAGLSLITPSRKKEFAYTTPIFDSVQEVVVTKRGGYSLSRLEDLAGKEVYVVRGSAQTESMENLNERLRKQRLPKVKVVQADPYVNQENLLEMLNAGIIPAVVVPDGFARLWSRVFKDLIVHEGFPLTSEMKAAWGMRKENVKLLASLNDAIALVLQKNRRAFEEHFNQYFLKTRWITNPFAEGSKSTLVRHFEKEASAFGMDWLQLMAQGFQESGLNPDARSPSGAVGIMQILPSTAEWLGITNYMETAGNIRAGAKYMNGQMNSFAKEPEVRPQDRFFFALAAYNAGPGRLGQYRKRARELGYDPDSWFGEVERVALRSGNLETVMYVRNIVNYTMAYKNAYERALLKPEK